MAHHRYCMAMLLAASVACAAFTTACGVENDDSGADESDAWLDEQGQAIRAGTSVSVAWQRRLGLVAIPGCSAVAITNQWVLTMYHCGDRTGQNVTFLGRTYRVDQAFMNPGYPGEQRNDSQLLRLETPLLNEDGTEWLYSLPLVGAMSADYPVGKDMLCFGTEGGATWKHGSFRGASMEVKNGRQTGFVKLSSGTYGIRPGDSGGPCFTVNSNGNTRNLVTITKGTEGGSAQGIVNPLRADLQAWMQEVMGF